MRFAGLSLERYGRFEGCNLTFRAGAPDLHIIYGANEAGKSTTLEAVSDLLFGFGARTPCNFLFDYSLLRVGAVLEEGGRTLACRRRKANSATLVDDGDRAIDDGELLSMLRSQTRETFRLGFSLDQLRLRKGGEAMVNARDDLGQALFAAGSGMTEIATTLKSLDEEADAIWGKRASAKRAYTIAEREWQESSKQLRESQLKPRTWTDAQGDLVAREKQVAELEVQRDTLQADRRRAERLRRIGPVARRRADLSSALAEHDETVALAPAREAMAEAALAAADEATRMRVAAETLLADVAERIAAIDPDEALLAAAPGIDELVERRGAIVKAAQDASRLRVEQRVKQERIDALRRDLESDAPVPSRLVVASLRELARHHADAVTRLDAIEQTRADLLARQRKLQARLADTALREDLPQLIASIDSARKLGADVDERCAALRRHAQRLSGDARAAFARLVPWTGTRETLEALPTIGDDEITAAQGEQARLLVAIDAANADILRIGGELAKLALESEALTTSGRAVSSEEVHAARSIRDEQWTVLRNHFCNDVPTPDPRTRSDAFEASVAGADRLADRRFGSAEASGRLAAVEHQRAEKAVSAEQARRQQADADGQLAGSRHAWTQRLNEAGLPELEPLRLRAWAADRAAATEADTQARQADDTAGDIERRRDVARSGLLALAPADEAAPDGLAAVLGRAEASRAEEEERGQAYRDDHLELRQIEDALAGERGRLEKATADRDSSALKWDAAVAQAGLRLAIDGAEARLLIFEELRTETDDIVNRSARLDGMDADARTFAADVKRLADAFGGAPDADPVASLEALRTRLVAARGADRALSELKVERSRRQSEVDAAAAAQGAAMQSLAPVLAEIGVDEVSAVGAAIEASRAARALRADLEEAERQIVAAGHGYTLTDLLAAWEAEDPDRLSRQVETLDNDLVEINARVTAAAEAQGEARRAFAALDGQSSVAANAASDAEQARAEMGALADAYVLKRAQSVTLRWAMERHRARRQNPMLLRAGELFSTLTLGRYATLKVDIDAAAPRLLGVSQDGRTVVDVDAMSEGTIDQLFLALRLAAIEQSAAAGVRLPFLADDLFVNFDDDRARAGFQVLAHLAQFTQVLFFTHHAHLAAIARGVVGASVHSECSLA